MAEQSPTGRRAGLGRIFISGYFGFGNLGDEAILEAVALELRRRHPSLAIAATFGEDRATAERLQVTPIDLFDLEGCAQAILGADLVLFGLGGVFQDYWGATLTALFREGSMGIEAWVRPALLARMGDVPAALFCGGVGPLRTPPGRAMFRMACEAADLLLVRDETSALEILDIVPAAKPLVAIDPAHDLEADEDDRRYADTQLREAGIEGAPISVAVRAWDLGMDRDHLVRQLAAGLGSLPTGHPIVFLPFHCGAGTDDREVADAIRAALPGRTTAVVAPRTGGQAIALFERSAPRRRRPQPRRRLRRLCADARGSHPVRPESRRQRGRRGSRGFAARAPRARSPSRDPVTCSSARVTSSSRGCGRVERV